MKRGSGKITIAIINFNGEKFLRRCLESVFALRAAAGLNVEVIFIDNASSDGSVEFVLKNFPKARVVANKENLGYAGAANQAVQFSKAELRKVLSSPSGQNPYKSDAAEFLMLLNPDIIFEPDYLEALVAKMKKDAKIGAAIGKLLKYDFDAEQHGEKTKIIDSTGLLMYKNRRCVDRGQGEEDRGQFEKAEEVFGVTGACPLYRVAALEECALKVGFGGELEIFDNDFFMYKEDVDIAWRLRLCGWKSFYLPESVAYHGRGTGAILRDGVLQAAKGRKSLSKFQKSLSYRNERLMRVKNDLGALVARDLPQIFWKEFLFFALAIVSENFLFKSLWQFLKLLPKALLKRRQIMKNRRVTAGEMGRWFV